MLKGSESLFLIQYCLCMTPVHVFQGGKYCSPNLPLLSKKEKSGMSQTTGTEGSERREWIPLGYSRLVELLDLIVGGGGNEFPVTLLREGKR